MKTVAESNRISGTEVAVYDKKKKQRTSLEYFMGGGITQFYYTHK